MWDQTFKIGNLTHFDQPEFPLISALVQIAHGSRSFRIAYTTLHIAQFSGPCRGVKCGTQLINTDILPRQALFQASRCPCHLCKMSIEHLNEVRMEKNLAPQHIEVPKQVSDPVESCYRPPEITSMTQAQITNAYRAALSEYRMPWTTALGSYSKALFWSGVFGTLGGWLRSDWLIGSTVHHHEFIRYPAAWGIFCPSSLPKTVRTSHQQRNNQVSADSRMASGPQVSHGGGQPTNQTIRIINNQFCS